MGTAGDDPKVFEAKIQVFVIFTWVLNFVACIWSSKDTGVREFCMLQNRRPLATWKISNMKN